MIFQNFSWLIVILAITLMNVDKIVKYGFFTYDKSQLIFNKVYSFFKSFLNFR